MNDSNYSGSEFMADSTAALEKDDLEDMVYEEFPGATHRGGATYDKNHFLSLFEIAHSDESPDYCGEQDGIETLLLEDSNGKALYGLVEHREDTVNFDIKIFGDVKGVERYIGGLPSEGYVEGVESVEGSASRGALARLGGRKHPMNHETETALSEPNDVPDEAFTNSQAERIKKEVLEDESI